MATATAQRMSQTQSSVQIVTPDPSSLGSVLLADGQWHNIRNAKKVQFAVTESQSPTNPDRLYAALLCEEEGREVVYPFSQIIGYSAEQIGSQSGRQQFGTTG